MANANAVLKEDRRRGPKLDPKKRALVQQWADRMRRLREERAK